MSTDPDERIYYAHKRTAHKGGVFYSDLSPDYWWVELYGMDDPIVKLRVRERLAADPPSEYWGWLDVKEPDRYIFVQPALTLLEMCFPYGSAIEEKHGTGRKVNLLIEELTAAVTPEEAKTITMLQAEPATQELPPEDPNDPVVKRTNDRVMARLRREGGFRTPKSKA